MKSNPEHLGILEQWMRSYRPELFDKQGTLVPELKKLPPVGDQNTASLLNPVRQR